nr:unnamed protein product [Callosobruchus chinensis]
MENDKDLLCFYYGAVSINISSRYSLVPLCRSTTVKAPKKVFIRLPQDLNRRKKWLIACRRETKDTSSNSNALHVGKDNFNISTTSSYIS